MVLLCFTVPSADEQIDPLVINLFFWSSGARRFFFWPLHRRLILGLFIFYPARHNTSGRFSTLFLMGNLRAQFLQKIEADNLHFSSVGASILLLWRPTMDFLVIYFPV